MKQTLNFIMSIVYENVTFEFFAKSLQCDLGSSSLCFILVLSLIPSPPRMALPHSATMMIQMLNGY
jgi:hypothetical protein